MKLYVWVVDKIVLVAIWFVLATVDTMGGWLIHAVVMEVLK